MILSNTLEAIQQVLWPAKCGACERYLAEDESAVCKDCRKTIHLCAERSIPDGFSGAFAFFEYEGVIQEMISKWKFSEDFNAQKALMILFSELCQDIHFDISKPATIIPVPPHPKRLRERGFDPAWMFAHTFYQQWLMPHPEDSKSIYFSDNCLIRSRYTRHQIKLSHEERQHNLDNAFSLKKEPPENVILIDDVITTGATARTCGEVLLAGGSSSLFLIGLASANA